MEICDYNSCTGCAACMNNCKHQAISMYPDRHGELHPLIDVDKCIECGLCINRCPVNKHTERLGLNNVSLYGKNHWMIENFQLLVV